MGCVDSMALPVTHRAHARSRIFKIVYQSAIKVNSTASTKSVVAIPMAIASVVLAQQDKV